MLINFPGSKHHETDQIDSVIQIHHFQQTVDPSLSAWLSPSILRRAIGFPKQTAGGDVFGHLWCGFGGKNLVHDIDQHNSYMAKLVSKAESSISKAESLWGPWILKA